ncbi:MAG: rod shape-determining protein MreC [Alistipes putredinis]|nr:MAG: rod shape-determining protein MreC [Alistipes putredinis]
MRRLLLFIQRIYVGLIFIVLEILALHFYCSSTAYTRAQLLSASNAAVGAVYGAMADVRYYFGLKKENAALLDEIVRLRSELTQFREHALDSTLVPQILNDMPQFSYMTARVVNNSVNRSENYITINKGEKDGVEPDMAVLSPQGALVGYVLSCSEKRAVCISALNTSFRASGSLKGSSHFGSLSWNGADRSHITLSEIPKYAPINIGDTIVTTSYSFKFPAGLEIGTVEKFEEVENTASYRVNVKLATDFTSLRNVILVKNADAMEQMYLEQEVYGGY